MPDCRSSFRLIAYGVFQMNTPLYGWQALFLIEGAFTIGFAVVAGLLLPWSPSTARFLNDREKEVARLRILRDGSTAVGTKVQLATFFKPLRDWKYYAFGSIGESRLVGKLTQVALTYGTGVAVASNFLTQIIGRFKYSVVKTNLFTVAPFITGTIILLATAFSSDHFRERGFHLASAHILVIVGCLILVGIPVQDKGVGYFATFLITGGAFTPSVIFHTWHQCNDPSEDGRAFRVGSFTFLANAGGIVSANIFRDEWAPKYIQPLAITAGLEALGLCLIISLRMWMYFDNRRRNKQQGVKWQSKDVPTEILAQGPSNPLFRHFY